MSKKVNIKNNNNKNKQTQNKKKILAVAIPSAIASAAIISSTIANSELDKLTHKSHLDAIFDVSTIVDDNEFAVNKQRKRVNYLSGEVVIPFNHEIIQAYTKKIQTQASNTTTYNSAVASDNLTEQQKAEVLQELIRSYFTLKDDDGNYVEYKANTDSVGGRSSTNDTHIIFEGRNAREANNLTVTYVSNNSSTTHDKFQIQIAGDTNTSGGFFEVPKFETKSVDATAMTDPLKAAIADAAYSLNTDIKMDLPKTDLQNSIWNSRPLNRSSDASNNNFYWNGNIGFYNHFKHVINASLNNWSNNNINNIAFATNNLKYWYSAQDKTFFVYNASQHRTFAFKNWDAYISLDKLVSVEDVFENLPTIAEPNNLTSSSNLNPFTSPGRRDYKIQEVLKRKLNLDGQTAKTNVKLATEKLETVLDVSQKKQFIPPSNDSNVEQSSWYRRYSRDEWRYRGSSDFNHIKYNYWEIKSDANNVVYKVVETKPMIQSSMGYYTSTNTPIAYSPYKDIITFYNVLNGRKEITLKDLYDADPNHYIIERIFKGQVFDRANLEEEVFSDRMDSRTLGMFLESETRITTHTNRNSKTHHQTHENIKDYDLTRFKLQLVQLGNRAGIVIRGAWAAIKPYEVNYMYRDNQDTSNNQSYTDAGFGTYAGREVIYLLDDFPEVVDNSKYTALTSVDYARYGFYSNPYVKKQDNRSNIERFWDNNYLKTNTLNNSNDEWRVFNQRYAKWHMGWTLFNKLTDEHKIPNEDFVDVLGRKVDIKKFVPFFYTKDQNDTSPQDDLLNHYALGEFSAIHGIAPLNKTRWMYKLHAIVKTNNNTPAPYMTVTDYNEAKDPGQQESQSKYFLKEYSAIAFNWSSLNNSDGILTTQYFINYLSKSPEVNYDNPVSYTGAGVQSDWKIPRPQAGERPKQKLFDQNANFDLREGYVNVYWEPDIQAYANDNKKVQTYILNYFIKLFKDRASTSNSNNSVDFNTQENRYNDNDPTKGLLTGFETFQYYPEYGSVVISDNGYYRDFENNNWVTKQRIINNVLTPAIKVIFSIPTTELGHNIYDAFDLSEANFDQAKAIEAKINKLQPNALGNVRLSNGLTVKNPKLSSEKYTVTDNVNADEYLPQSSTTNRNSYNGPKFTTKQKNIITFEDAIGREKKILVYDFDIINETIQNGRQIFRNVPEFNNFYKGQLQERQFIDLPSNSDVSSQAITELLTNLSQTDTTLSRPTGDTANGGKYSLTNIKVAKLNNRLVIQAQTGRFGPPRVPDAVKTKVIQEPQYYYLYIDNLPLYYEDVNIKANTPTIKQLVDSNLTFEQYVLDQLDKNQRDVNNLNKITIGPSNNPDLDADNTSDLQVVDINYEDQTYSIVNIVTSKSVKIKATTNRIPQINYVLASTTNANNASLKNFSTDLLYVNETIYNHLSKLDASDTNLNPRKGNPLGYINIPHSDANSEITKLYKSDEIKAFYPSNMKEDSQNVEIRYNSKNSRLIIIDNGQNTQQANTSSQPNSSTATPTSTQVADQTNNNPSALVINLMPKTIWGAELVDKNNTTAYTQENGKDLLANKILENKGDVIKTITSLLSSFDNNSTDNKKYIGGYALNNPVVLKNKQNSLIQIQTDDKINPNDANSKNETVGIYDHYSYFLNPVNGASLFADYEKLLQTIEASKLNAQQPATSSQPAPSTASNQQEQHIKVDSFKYNLKDNNDLLLINQNNQANNNVRAKVSSNNSTTLNEDENQVKVIYTTYEDENDVSYGRFIVKGFIEENNDINKVAFYTIDKVPNVVRSNNTSLAIPSLDEIIAENGDEYKALKSKWMNYTAQSGNDAVIYTPADKMIQIGLRKFNLETAKLHVDETTRKILTISDPNTDEVLAVVILNEPLKRVVAKNVLYNYYDVVDNKLDLKATIENKITSLGGLEVDDGYNLTGYSYDENNQTSYNNKQVYVLKNGDQEVFVIDEHKYNKSGLNQNDLGNLFDAKSIFSNQSKFSKLYEELDGAAKNISNLTQENVKALKDWLQNTDQSTTTQQNNINEQFKSNYTDNVSVERYKDVIILVSPQKTDTQNQQPNTSPKQVLAIGNLPGIIFDTQINLDIPTLDELLANNKSLTDEIKDRLVKLDTNTVDSFVIDGQTFNKNQVNIRYLYDVNRIVIEENEKVVIIASSRNLPNIKFVDANQTKPSNKQTPGTQANQQQNNNAISEEQYNKMLDFSLISNAYYVNNLYKEINRAVDWSSADVGAKLVSSLKPDVVVNTTYNLKEQFKELIKDLVDTHNQQLFDSEAVNLSIKYEHNNDRLIIKDNDQTPVALVINNLNKYTDDSRFAILNNNAIATAINLDVQNNVNSVLNQINANQQDNNSKIVANYKVYEPEFDYGSANDLYAKIKFKKQHTDSTKDGVIYLVNETKYFATQNNTVVESTTINDPKEVKKIFDLKKIVS